MFRYFTLESFDFSNKIVGVRVDINSPVIDGKVVDNERISSSAVTIKEISDEGGKVVVLAHQGREGKSDCVSLKEHVKLLEKYVGKKIQFISEVYSKSVVEKINSLKSGEILLLENLRFLKEETDMSIKDNNILKLEKLFNYYVFDAFSVSHREHSSVVGFKNIPNIAGRLVEKEVNGLNEISETKSPHIFIFGGAKPDDLIELLEIDLKLGKVDLVLLMGVIGELALHIKGFNIGKKLDFMQEHNFLDSKNRLKILLDKYSDKIFFPKDVALFDGKNRVEISLKDFDSKSEILSKYLIQDIGSETLSFYSKFISMGGSIYVKGPAGNFEDKNFQFGTKELLKLITSSHAFTFMGGGHSVTSAVMFKVFDKFSYVSLAGGALVRFLSGKSLYGVDILEKSCSRFEHFNDEFIVVGSNVIDLGINVPEYFNNIHLGDKIKVTENFKNTVGGGGINVSVCLARLGSKVSYLGKLSYECVNVIKEVLDKNKIGLIESKITKKPCAKSALIDTKDEDRVILTYRGQNSDLELSDFDPDSFRSKNYYFSSLMETSFETQLKLSNIIKKRNPHSKICYNLSSYLIKNEKRVKSLIKNCDVLILNYDEAQEFTGEKSISSCLKNIREYVIGIVIITDGSRGSFAYDGEREYFVKSVKANKVIDTTGAGDCYGGTFFYFYSKGFGIKKSMKYAAKNASSVVSKKGAQDGLQFYDDLIKD